MGSLHQCLNEKRYHQFIYLVKLKSNLDELDEHLHTPLIKICSSMDNAQACKLIRVLVANGARADVVDEEGLSPLHIACKRNNADLARTLLRLLPDCPVNTTDMYGNTPLHYAASHEQTDIIKLILPLLKKYQINTDSRNKLGFTPLLIAASNGRLEVARYIADKASVSTIVYDSFYFTSLDDWFRIYYDWPLGQKILTPSTPATRKDSSSIRVEKENLVPVNTRPAVNSLLDNYSRTSSAMHSYSGSGSRIPKIVVTQPSSENVKRRVNTAPLNGKYNKPFVNPLPLRPRAKDGWITLNISNIPHHSSSKQDGRCGGERKKGQLSPPIRPADKMSESHWESMQEMVSICSEQLSDAYRKTITPTWETTPTAENEDLQALVEQLKGSKQKADSKAASILLGMIGKSRRTGSEMSISVEDEQQKSPKASFKLLKSNLRRVSQRRGDDEGSEENPEEKERVEKAANILNRVLNTKKRTPPKPSLVQAQQSLIAETETTVTSP